jgi:hypothetical protein
VLLLEDLKDDPRQAFQEVCRFLEIDHTFVPPNVGTAVNSYISFRSPRLRAFYRHPRFRRLPVLRRAMGHFNTRQGVAYPPLDPKVRDEMQQCFEKDNAALAEWLGRDLSHWGRLSAAHR